MRKTLLIAAATLAAGVISSQAAVYSQNIVGYVNVPSPVGYASLATPLYINDASGNNNNATNFLDCVSGNSDGNVVLQWSGHGYSQVQVDSTSGTGFSDINTGNPLPAPILAPGTGWLLENVNSSNTVVFAGQVATATGPASVTNFVGTTTNVLSVAHVYQLAASVLPIGGGISSVLQLTNPIVGGSGVLDGSVVLIPNIVLSGGKMVVHGYAQTQFDSTSGTGFSDINSGNPLPEPQIPVGSGFLFENLSGADFVWNQSL